MELRGSYAALSSERRGARPIGTIADHGVGVHGGYEATYSRGRSQLVFLAVGRLGYERESHVMHTPSAGRRRLFIGTVTLGLALVVIAPMATAATARHAPAQ